MRELLTDPPPVAISPARRAQQTLEGLALGWPELAATEHRTEEDLYTFSAHDLLSWLVLQDDALPELLLVGHNPALTDLVNTLCPQQYLDNLPTAGYVQLTLEIVAWRELPARQRP